MQVQRNSCVLHGHGRCQLPERRSSNRHRAGNGVASPRHGAVHQRRRRYRCLVSFACSYFCAFADRPVSTPHPIPFSLHAPCCPPRRILNPHTKSLTSQPYSFPTTGHPKPRRHSSSTDAYVDRHESPLAPPDIRGRLPADERQFGRLIPSLWRLPFPRVRVAGALQLTYVDATGNIRNERPPTTRFGISFRCSNLLQSPPRPPIRRRPMTSPIFMRPLPRP